MKKFILITFMFLTAFSYSQIGINTNSPDASSALDIESTTGGILIPRLTETQRNAITDPASGLMIYQIDQTLGFYFYNGNAWIKFDDASAVGGWYEDKNSPSSSEITVGNLMFRKNNTDNYLEVKALSNADFYVNVINDPFDSSNNYSKAGAPSGGAQYIQNEWRSIVQVYDFNNQNYDLVPENLTFYKIRVYEIIETDNISAPTSLKKYKIREFVDGYDQYVYSVEYNVFY